MKVMSARFFRSGSGVDSRSSFSETGHRRVRNILAYIKLTREAR